ncbi:MAG: 4Fe-4S dicluster domain-containing protein [Melioribacteraceae bacterium]|jgi:formate dehydrogenase iron-sulfur subunit|nr:4Fe-4S dicluster domain-containing protein [Melioribacteraceae bacterium]
MSQNRRDFLKTFAAIGTTAATLTAVSPKVAKASSRGELSVDRNGVLVDTTTCIGCGKCEWACKTAHHIEPGNIEDYSTKLTDGSQRRPSEDALTVVNQIDKSVMNSDKVKLQCMHCDHPACVSACIVGAIKKQENGAVTWDTDVCIGCRYCMIACPFQIPAFEYHKALDPKIAKCDFCYDRTQEGKLPACAEICPVGALTYGTREELVIEAKRRIEKNPEKYHDHVFGEHEVGGTSWLYLAENSLVETVFPKLGTNPAPGVSESIQHGLFAYFVPPVALYALLGGVMWLSKTKENEGGH